MGLVHATERTIKARIIAIMSVVKARLRRQRITLGAGTDEGRFDAHAHGHSLIDTIRQRGCEMPGNRFSDIFLSRPQRVVNASVHELVTTFEVILEHGNTMLLANELIELCELTRVPFSAVQPFARFYPVDQWRAAMLQYNVAPQSDDDEEIVERSEVLADIERLLTQTYDKRTQPGPSHIIISGPSGIGKTAVAIAAARRIEPMYARRIPIVVLGPDVTSLEQVYRAIGVTVGMKLIGAEPWALRMRHASALRNAIVILDNVMGVPGLSPESVLNDIGNALPTTRCIVTTQMVGLAQFVAHSHEITLEPLDETQRTRLFWRIYRNAHGQDIDPSTVRRLLAESYGYPMHIVASANAVAHGGAWATDKMYDQVIAAIPREAVPIVQLLSLVHQPLSLAFLQQVRGIFGMERAEDIQQIVQQLERRQILTVRRSEGYVMHDALRRAVRMVMTAADTEALLKKTAEAIHTEAILREDSPAMYFNNLLIHEVLAVLELIPHLQQYELYDAIGRIAVHWRMIWIRYGLCAEWCTITDDVARTVGEGDSAYAQLLYALGSFYGHRGMVERTVASLQTAMRIAEQRNQTDVWAMTALECALHGLSAIGIPESERLLLRALAQFERIGDRYWVARCYDTLSYVYIAGGQLQSSVKANDEALTLYGTAYVTHGRGDAHANRGLIFMSLGDYEIARQEMIKAEQIFLKLNAPANTAAVHLRIAAICALWNRATDARFYLVKAFSVLERSGGLNDLLFVIDICAGLALAEGDGRLAIQLSAACTQLRQHHNIPRGEALEAIVVRQLTYAHVLNNNTHVTPLAANLMDLILTVRTYLHGNEPLLWE
ncbi:MAG: hypothetical protein RLY87_439 [Chloroflexota bacterium]|jgi:tetratricopeptide (TPR) repeat protein